MFLKQGWLSAQAAVMRQLGNFFSIFAIRETASGSSFLYYSLQRQMLLALFWARTQLQVLPGNALTPRRRMWKMRPRENISQMGSYLVFMSLMLMTSGATQPGVPQRTKRQASASENSASPKSAIMHSQLFQLRNIRFQGLRSRCIIFLECIYLSPERIEQMIVFVSWLLNLYLALTLSQSCPPSRSSTTMQREFSDSNTSYSLIQYLWFSARMTSISLMRHSFPLSSLQAASLEKALTAQNLPFSSFSARQTEAKLPLPIFFLGLNCSWNPRWLSLPLSIYRQVWTSASDLSRQVAFSSLRSKVICAGESRNEYLTSKSKRMDCFFFGHVSMSPFSQRLTVTSTYCERQALHVKSSLPGCCRAPAMNKVIVASMWL